jgi:sporulation protein YqfC
MKKNKLLRKIDNYINEREFSIIYKNNKLNVVNYTKILDFSSSLISFKYIDKIYQIEGENLVISKMMENEILIEGIINKITFM